MRNLRLLALVAPVLLLPAACEDSTSGSSGSFDFDSGGGFEGGPVSEAGSDAGTDAAADADAGPAALVTVLVTDGVTAQKDVRVILHDATGAVTGDQKTDATGTLALTVVPSMVTVLATTSGSPSPVTFTSVTSGDMLTVLVMPPSATTIGNYGVTLTDSAVSTGASLYEVFVGGNQCSSTSNAIRTLPPVLLFDYCVAARTSVLARASSSDGNTVGFTFAKDVAKPAAGATLAVAPPAFIATGKTTITASNLPQGPITNLGTAKTARLGSVSNGMLFDSNQSGFGAIDDGGLTYDTATAFAESYQTTVDVGVSGSVASHTAMARREATTAPARATLADFDFTTALPFVNTAVLDATVAGRPSVTVTAGAALTGADLGMLRVRWDIGANGAQGSWTIIAPPTTTVFQVPALPADATTFVPAATVRFDTTGFVDSSLLTSYAQAKALPVACYATIDLLDSQKLLPTVSTVRYTYASFQLR